MESTAEPQQGGAARLPQHGRPSKRHLKLQIWESHRDETYEIYVVQNHTLQATMRILKQKHDFAPSVRKFRNKIKEWKFEKYLSAEESRFIAMKAKAREKEGKDTTFFKNGIRIDQKRIGKSIKRTRDDFEELDAFTAATPQQITYQSPLSEQNDDSVMPSKSSERKRRDQDQMHGSHEPFAYPSAKTPITVTSVTEGSELYRSADSSGIIKETITDSTEVVEMLDNKAENDTIELQSVTVPSRLSRESAISEVAPRVQSQAKGDWSYVTLKMDDDILYNCRQCSDRILGAELYLPEASASWIVNHSEPVENTVLEIDRETPSPSPIIYENIHVPTTDNEPSDCLADKQATPDQTNNLSVVDAQLSRFVERTRMYGTRFIVRFGSPLKSPAVTSINELRNIVSTRETTDGVSAFGTLKAVRNLARALEENGGLEDAISLYRRAIAGFEILGTEGFQQRLGTQLHLGKLFYSKQCDTEAERLLTIAASGYRGLQLDHLEISALGCLLDACINLHVPRKVDVMRRMRTLLSRPMDKDTVGLPLFLLEGMHLAKVYFNMHLSDHALSVMRDVVTKLELLDDKKYGIDKLEGYLEYSCICQREWCCTSRDEIEKYLHLARDVLNRASLLDAEAMRFVDAHLQGGNEVPFSPWEEAKLLQKQADIRVQCSLRMHRDTSPYGSSKTDTESSAYGSSRYGVTYPRSESTGGDISEFLYP